MENQPSTTEPIENTPSPFAEDGLPGILRVLTVLTIIGSALSIFSSFFTSLGCKVLMMEEVVDKMKPADLAILRATCEHKDVFMLASILSGVLCIVGAIMMRRLKKQGFVVYVVGQILPSIISIILMSEHLFSDWKSLIGYGIMGLFIGLYATQRKHLIY